MCRAVQGTNACFADRIKCPCTLCAIKAELLNLGPLTLREQNIMMFTLLTRILRCTPVAIRTFKNVIQFNNTRVDVWQPYRRFSWELQMFKRIMRKWLRDLRYLTEVCLLICKISFIYYMIICKHNPLVQWRTQEFCSRGGGVNKFSWGQRTEIKVIRRR